MMSRDEERLADMAMLAMFKLRDALVQRDANTDACKIDRLMSQLQAWSKEQVK
jgi:hypothetical protein